MSYDYMGKTIFNPSKADPQHEPWQIPCGKCIPCRFAKAREKSIRAWHESKTSEGSIFLTLTYAPENLKSERLEYPDFQKFIRALRKKTPNTINYMVSGEYGEITKRPHWHAIIYNYTPPDAKYHRKSELGHKIYISEKLSELWKHGFAEFGNVTLQSANYVARYQLKKLVHGFDQDHDFHPIHRTSCKNAIGKKWIEQNFKHTFENGFIVYPDGTPGKIPRYYEDWLKINQPDLWRSYVTELKQLNQKIAQENTLKEFLYDEKSARPANEPQPLLRRQVKLEIQKYKFKTLQEKIKL